jgi:GNAT superfamily N-acetyltransferase
VTAPLVTIRPCVEGDAESLVNLVRELAVYERLEQFARATADDFRRHLFGPTPVAEAIVAEAEGQPVGFALFFMNFSTFRGQPGIYLEDLFVQPDHRGKGVGKRLLAAVASRAVERGCGRLNWSVLDWNEPSIGFYRSLGAQPLDDWTIFRLDEEALARLASLAL